MVNKVRWWPEGCRFVGAPGFGDRLGKLPCSRTSAIPTSAANKAHSGQVISEDLGIKLENVTLDMLGRAKRVSIEKETTTIIDGSRW